MGDPKFDLDIGDNLKATVVITCGNCSRKTRKPLERAAPNTVIKCSCGTEIKLTGGDLRKSQRELDKFKRTLDDFGK